MKTKRASMIARELNKTKKWHVHGHGISMEVLEKNLKLQIDDFGKNSDTCAKIRDYYELLSDYMSKRATQGVIHFAGTYRPFI